MAATDTAVEPRVHAVLPAPSWRRAGDFVFVSSLYPLAADGGVVHTSSSSPYIGESEPAAQARSVLEALRRLLAEAGSSLELTLKVEVYLADAADFHEFKLVYQEFFPADPPARTTIVVGDEHIFPGCRLNLQAVALAADSSFERESIRAEGVPDPLAAEHAALAIKAGPFLFASAFPATDFQTGLAVGKKPGFPNYGSDAEMQARYAFDNLSKVVAAGGSSIDQALKVQFYETSLLDFHDVDGIWGEYVGVPPTRSSMGCRGFLVPGALFAVNGLFLVPDDRHAKVETRAGIRWHPVDVAKVNFSPGIVAGDWLFTAGQIPVPDLSRHDWVGAPAGLPYYWDDIELETEFTLQLLHEQLAANGFSLVDVVDARVYLVDPRRDFRGFERAWRRAFAGVEAMPAMSLIPSRQANGESGVMISGPQIEIDLISKRIVG
jgi:enamine deaminase RidA (YjgF/YER057c/UK114 family)